jgi:Zn-dependent peptidase ImmA (M78 family)
MAHVPERYAATSRADARLRAEKLLARLGYDGVEERIDVEALASVLGIKLVPVDDTKDLTDDFAGAFMQRNGESYIFINTGHPPPRQRFSIAHEIGHFILHSTEGDDGVFFRNDRSSEGTDVREIQANAFASSLLMPESAVRHHVREPVAAYDFDAISKLKNQFDVSEQAIILRLHGLKLLTP